MDVGNKIKQIRLYKKMTQSDLAEGIITRNMLSAIENSKALPSLTVLKMLADKLGVSCDLLLSDDDVSIETLMSTEKKLPLLRKLFSAKKYPEVVKSCKDITLADNFEIKYMMAISYFNLSVEALFNGEHELFEDNLSKSRELFSMIGLSWFDSFFQFFQDFSEGAFEGKLPSLSDCKGNCRGFAEIFFYLYILKLIERDQTEKAAEIYDSVNFTFEPIRYHINSRLAASKFNINRAKELLDEMIEKKPDLPLPFMQIIYSELEHYCTLTGDYKRAYECATHKMEISSKSSAKKC